MSETPSPAQAEQYTGPHAERLVDADLPERRAYTVDGITTPDFDFLMGNEDLDMLDEEFLIKPRAEGGFELSLKHPEQGDTQTLSSMPDSVESWVCEAAQAVNLVIPEQGVDLIFNRRYLEPTIGTLPIDGNGWHNDGMIYIANYLHFPTEIADANFQNSFVRPTDELGRELTIYDTYGEDDEELEVFNVLTEDRIRRPLDGQTLVLAPEAIHRAPRHLNPMDTRPGIFCFIGSSEDAMSINDAPIA